MYKKILIALDNSPADNGIIAHVAELAARFGSKILLLHVADGFAARCFESLKLAESDEMKADHNYLETTASDLRAKNFPRQHHHRSPAQDGNPLARRPRQKEMMAGDAAKLPPCPTPASAARSLSPAPRNAAGFPRHPQKTAPARRPPPRVLAR